MKNMLQSLETLRKKQSASSHIFKPEFYRLHDKNQRSAFEELLKTEGLFVNDYIRDQLRELIKFEQSHKKFSEAELDQLVTEKLAGREISEYGVWVYYPWSLRLVHLLDEEEFVTVRTSRNQYKITPREKEILSKKKIGVIGLSVGQSVSVTLAMERICGELRLADFDVLELTNLNRIRTGVHNLGLPKVYSVAREIAEIDPFLTVRCFVDGLTEQNMDEFFLEGGKLDLLVEESDGFDIKILSRYKARELRVPVIMEGSDRCLVDVERFDLEPQRSILHGLVDHLDIALLKTLKTNEQKIPYMLDILGLESCSLRLKASMLEIEQSVNTWPQLASAVTMGGGITADVSRRMLLNQYTGSGRFHIDIEELIGDQKPTFTPPPVTPYSPLTLNELKSLHHPKKENAQVKVNYETLLKLVEAACLAPSGGNSQPWRWVYVDDCVLLYNGLAGAPGFLTFNDLPSYVALGAAAQNLQIAAAHNGLDCKAELFPVKELANLVAVFRFYQATDVLKPFVPASAISTRLTNRRLGERKKIAPELLQQLSAAAQEPGIQVKFFSTEKELEQIADVLGELDVIRVMDSWGHRDFVNEIRWTTEENELKRDGIDLRTLEITASEKVGLEVFTDPRIRALLNDWNGGGAFKKLAKKSIDAAGAVGILILDSTAPKNYFKGGMALERLWLMANHLGIAFQPMSASVFAYARLMEGKGEGMDRKTTESLRRLRNIYEETFAIPEGKRELFVFRLSTAAEPEIKSLRRPLNELLSY